MDNAEQLISSLGKKTTTPPKQESFYLKLLQLEGDVRDVDDIPALRFFMVNESRRVMNYRQAFLFEYTAYSKQMRLMTASSLSMIERHAPIVQWLEATLAAFLKDDKQNLQEPIQLTAKDCPKHLRDDWNEFSMPNVLWIPLDGGPKDALYCGLWLVRETAWCNAEMVLAKRLRTLYSYSWRALSGKKARKPHHPSWRRFIYWSFLIALIIVQFLPVRLSVLAPAEVVAKSPTIVTAPIEGVIEDIHYLPNTYVTMEDKLVTLEDTELSNAYALAEKKRDAKMIEYKTIKQRAFTNFESKSQVAILKQEVELAEAELDYHQERLAMTQIKAPVDGILLYSDKKDWVGRPIKVGERIMEIANPENVELRINLPVGDAIILEQGDLVEVFLDADPLNPVSASVERASYQADEVPGDILAYRVTALFSHNEAPARIGLRGTAKIYSQTVPLYFYLFRRVISSTRQYLGL